MWLPLLADGLNIICIIYRRISIFLHTPAFSRLWHTWMILSSFHNKNVRDCYAVLFCWAHLTKYCGLLVTIIWMLLWFNIRSSKLKNITYRSFKSHYQLRRTDNTNITKCYIFKILQSNGWEMSILYYALTGNRTSTFPGRVMTYNSTTFLEQKREHHFRRREYLSRQFSVASLTSKRANAW